MEGVNRSKLRVIASTGGVASMVGGTSASLIGLFFVFETLADYVVDCWVVEDPLTRPHRPGALLMAGTSRRKMVR